MSNETPLKGRGGGLGAVSARWRGWRNEPVQPRLPPAVNGTSRDADDEDADDEVASSRGVSLEVAHALAGAPRLSLRAFLSRELSWGHGSWRGRASSTEHVVNFLRVPLRLEPFLTFGHLV